MNDQPLSAQEFQDALVCYLNGTLEASERDRVERQLSSDPDAAAVLARQRVCREAVRQRAADMPADLGWADYAKRHGLDAAPAEATAGVLAVRKRPFRLAHGLTALVVCQAVAIGVLWHGRGVDGTGYSTVRGGAASTQSSPLLQVRFKPEATEQQVRKLLVGVDARIVDGPSQLGDYLVAVPDGQLDAARQALASSALVLDAVVQR